MIAAALAPAGRATGPLGRYLEHPDQVLARLARAALAVLAAWGPAAGPAIAAAVVAALAGRAWLRRRRHAALADGARIVEILAPPVADPAGGQALWANLAGLMRPPLARWRHGQPHLAWEYAWDSAGMSVTLWVPGPVPPGLAERAVEAAWPGAHARPGPATPPLPPRCLVTGGTLRLARPEILPLRSDHGSDPLRALAGAGAGLGPGEHAVVQVLARPATGHRLRRARRAARRLRYGQPARLSSRLMDLVTPGPRGAARRAAIRTDPEAAAGLREAAVKAVGPQWETLIRYAAATTAVPAGRPRGAEAVRARRRLRGLAVSRQASGADSFF